MIAAPLGIDHNGGDFFRCLRNDGPRTREQRAQQYQLRTYALHLMGGQRWRWAG